jgi:hypothetical protein
MLFAKCRYNRLRDQLVFGPPAENHPDAADGTIDDLAAQSFID